MIVLDKIIKKYYSDIKILPNEKGIYFDNMSKTFTLNVKDICDILFDFKFKSNHITIFPTTIYTYEDYNGIYVITHEISSDGYWNIILKNLKNNSLYYFENNFDEVNHTLF